MQEVKHYKVKKLPLVPNPNSVYYVKLTSQSEVETYITDQNGQPFPLIDLSGGTINSVTGTGVTGTSLDPIINIDTFKSTQLGNLLELSTTDGKLFVKPITSPDGSINVSATSSALEIEISSELQALINSAVQPENLPTKTSDLTNDGEDGVNSFITLQDLPPLPPTILSALPFTTDHLTATNNPYIIGDVVYYLGDVYKCIANNDSIIPDNTSYWENIGPGFPIVQQPIDWDSTSSNNQILNKPAIPSITVLVPYTGATENVDLGLFEITAAKLIKDGGQPEQFLKADGSVDNNVYLTSADLPATLDLYATTTASDIPGYSVLVRNIADIRFNTTAADVPTGLITTNNQLVGQLITDSNILSGNPGVFNITTIGNISRTSGTGQAEFYFKIYKRTSAGLETFITESDKTLPVTNGGYSEFSATALWNDGIFLDTDRIVIKYYADRLTSPVGSDPNYNFQFGGLNPVRSSAAIPTSVLPNIYLKDLADVENVDPLDKEILYWNDTDSLWEHSLTEDLIPNASATQKGLVSTGAQTLAGEKTFLNPTLIKSDYNALRLTSSVYSPGSAGNVMFFDVFDGTSTYSSINSRTNGGGASNDLILQSPGNGNVGIGTIAPTAKLDVNGDVKISDGLEVAGTVILPSTTSIGDVSDIEIGYLNGVTSSIQVQLDSKPSSTALIKKVLSNTVATAAVSGTTLQTLIYSAPVILGGTFSYNDFFNFQVTFRKQPQNAITCTYRFYVSNTNNFATASLLATWASVRFNTVVERKNIFFKANGTINTPLLPSTIAQTDITNQDTAVTSLAVTPVNDIYFFVSVQFSGIGDNVQMTAIKIQN